MRVKAAEVSRPIAALSASTIVSRAIGAHSTFLESSTLTPLLKKLEAKELVLRNRRKDDERVVEVSLTSKGAALEREAKDFPRRIIELTKCSSKQVLELKSMLYRLLKQLDNEPEGQQEVPQP